MKWLLLIFPFFTFLTPDTSSDWKLATEEDGVSVYTRITEKSPIKEVKVKMTLNAELDEFLHILNDVDNYTNWVYKCEKAEKLESISKTEFIYYTESDFPFPISNRDMVVHSTQMVNEGNNSVRSHSISKPDKIEEVKGIVRIRKFEASWHIQELADGNLEIDYMASTDPGGYLPAWLINLGMTAAPLNTMKELKNLATQP